MNVLMSILIIFLIINIINNKRNTGNFNKIDLEIVEHRQYLKKKISSFDYILDVRTIDEVNLGSMKNIIKNKFIHKPYNEINKDTNLSFNDSYINIDSNILIYCRSGRRSLIAYDELKNKYKESRVVINGGYEELKNILKSN